MERKRMVITATGRVAHEAISFIIFSFLDLLDFILCFVFKVVDFFIEAEWRPCYCKSAKEAITSTGKILVSEKGEMTKVVCLSSSKIELEDISDTLYTRPSFVSEMSKLTVNVIKRIKVKNATAIIQQQNCEKTIKRGNSNVRSSSFTINSTIVEMLQGKMGGQLSHPIPRWSDCDCNVCTCWITIKKESLFVNNQGPNDNNSKEDVLFIHGFVSSSSFWAETLFPNFSTSTKSSHRLFAVDLLGFGRSPKPTDSLYTLREHLDMIERSVIEPYNVKSFHIVAHSLGCILALALAIKYPKAIKSLTLIAPPYYVVPKGEQAGQYVMRKVAPRRVWPMIAFGASLACWYEHITRLACYVVCKNHRLWDFLFKLVTRNRIRTFLIEGFFCHTHYGAWHTLHNIIYGTASKIGGYLDIVRDQMKCDVNVFHGEDDELIPIECSLNIQKSIPRARVKVIQKKDHLTIVVGRQKSFARELEEIWKRSSSSSG